jgi:hypothetical protein
MKRIIAMSLYGNNPRYTLGAIENAKLKNTIYPEWVLRFYVGPEVDKAIVKQLNDLGSETQIIETYVTTGQPNTNSALEGTIWRFLPISEPNTEYFISRDADSRLNVRERAAVDAWIASGKKAHVMRDHYLHGLASQNGKAYMMCGMWGIKGGVILDIVSLLKKFRFTGQYWDDADFLNAYVWPLVKDDILSHGFYGLPFPPHAPYKGFVGEAFVDV